MTGAAKCTVLKHKTVPVPLAAFSSTRVRCECIAIVFRDCSGSTGFLRHLGMRKITVDDSAMFSDCFFRDFIWQSLAESLPSYSSQVLHGAKSLAQGDSPLDSIGAQRLSQDPGRAAPLMNGAIKANAVLNYLSSRREQKHLSAARRMNRVLVITCALAWVKFLCSFVLFFLLDNLSGFFVFVRRRQLDRHEFRTG